MTLFCLLLTGKVGEARKNCLEYTSIHSRIHGSIRYSSVDLQKHHLVWKHSKYQAQEIGQSVAA